MFFYCIKPQFVILWKLLNGKLKSQIAEITDSNSLPSICKSGVMRPVNMKQQHYLSLLIWLYTQYVIFPLKHYNFPVTQFIIFIQKSADGVCFISTALRRGHTFFLNRTLTIFCANVRLLTSMLTMLNMTKNPIDSLHRWVRMASTRTDLKKSKSLNRLLNKEMIREISTHFPDE